MILILNLFYNITIFYDKSILNICYKKGQK
jgi:hypothetical protein